MNELPVNVKVAEGASVSVLSAHRSPSDKDGNWCSVAVLSVVGDIFPNDEERPMDEETSQKIFDAMNGAGLIAPAGSGDPGQPFARCPSFFRVGTNFLIVTQSGGLDI